MWFLRRRKREARTSEQAPGDVQEVVSVSAPAEPMGGPVDDSPSAPASTDAFDRVSSTEEPSGQVAPATSDADETTSGGAAPPPPLAFVSATVAASAASATVDADYLARLMAQGGDAVLAYKTHSYDLLQLRPGMTVVDVGCGTGHDLLELAKRVGHEGHVIGVEINPELASRALVLVAENALTATVEVRCEDGEALSLADVSVDAIRADRALQYFPQPERALAEMWRVLRPDGRLAVVEPDWKLIGIDPGSASGQNDDSALDQLLRWYQHEWPQPLIGRRLYGILHAMGNQHWSEVQVQPVAFAVNDWRLVDSIVEVRGTVAAILNEDPSVRDEMQGWLTTLSEADRQGTFFAIVPLVFATARKQADPAAE